MTQRHFLPAACTVRESDEAGTAIGSAPPPEKSMMIAGKICIFTNANIAIEEL